MADLEARGGSAGDGTKVAELIAWLTDVLASVKAVSKTQTGNITRLQESLGHIAARHLTAGDVIEHARRRISGDHMTGKGVIIPACSPATMNVALGCLSELLKLAAPMKGVKLGADPVAEARPALQQLRGHFDQTAWRSQIPMANIIDFAMLSAKRQGEINRLLSSDVDVTTRTALLRDAKHPRKKAGNHKRFPLLGDAWTIVQRQPRIVGEDRIFPYNTKSISTAFTRTCIRLVIADLCFHVLRHEATRG